MKISVVVPTYNEKENIPLLVKAIFEQAKILKQHTIHVIIADSMSPDGSGDMVRQMVKETPNLHLIEDKRRGIGVGLLTGFTYAFDTLKSNAAISMDADFSHNPEDLPRMIKKLEDGYHVVIGSRYMKGGRTENWSIVRKMGSLVINQYIQFVLGMKPADSTTDYRLYTRDVWEKLDKERVPWERRSFLATLAILYYALKVSPNFAEIPVAFPDRERGYSKALLINYAIDIFKFGLKERRNTILTFFKFLGIGLTGVLVNLSMLYFLVEYVDIHQEFASPIAVEFSIITNFLLHNFWTFRGRAVASSIPARFIKYNVISLISLSINFAIFLLCTRVFHFHYLVAQLIGIAFATPGSFLASMKWAWRRK